MDPRATQRGRILELLSATRGAWVPLPKIAACAAQYNARIFELRHLGFRIPPPRIQLVGGKKHSWYRLEPTPIPSVATEPFDHEIKDAADSLPLFGEAGRP